jgi:NADPH:quinone reductase
MITDRISIIITKKQKSDTFVWELMFTSSLFQTQDMIVQYHLLNAVTSLIDSKKIKTTLTDLLSPINAENLRRAHKKLESCRTIGKMRCHTVIKI